GKKTCGRTAWNISTATTTDFPTADRRTNCSTKYSASPANRFRYIRQNEKPFRRSRFYSFTPVTLLRSRRGNIAANRVGKDRRGGGKGGAARNLPGRRGVADHDSRGIQEQLSKDTGNRHCE